MIRRYVHEKRLMRVSRRPGNAMAGQGFAFDPTWWPHRLETAVRALGRRHVMIQSPARDLRIGDRLANGFTVIRLEPIRGQHLVRLTFLEDPTPVTAKLSTQYTVLRKLSWGERVVDRKRYRHRFVDPEMAKAKMAVATTHLRSEGRR